MQPPVFWDITLCSPLEALKALLITCFMLGFIYSSILKKKAACSSYYTASYARRHYSLHCTRQEAVFLVIR
jgi:hypothetical protein